MAQKRKILFIDDNPADSALISSLLTKYDFDVLLAEDGARGLKMAQDTPKHLIDYASYGAQDYIQKTMPPEELVASIKSILH